MDEVKKLIRRTLESFDLPLQKRLGPCGFSAGFLSTFKDEIILILFKKLQIVQKMENSLISLIKLP